MLPRAAWSSSRDSVRAAQPQVRAAQPQVRACSAAASPRSTRSSPQACSNACPENLQGVKGRSHLAWDVALDAFLPPDSPDAGEVLVRVRADIGRLGFQNDVHDAQ